MAAPSQEILLFGGRNYPHPQQRPAWDTFETALMVKLRGGEIVDRFEYPGCALDREVGVSVCFKAATIAGDHAYACTNTEVLKIDLRRLSVVDRHTHRLFNDLHHVNRIGDRFFVAGTGTDSVLEYDDRFELVRRYPIASDEILQRFGADADYRRIPNTKPHHAHPNFVAAWGGEVWVTNFETRQVESLQGSRKYRVSENKIHDGIPALGKIWFTAVNGEVIKLDPETGATERFDLTPMTNASRLLGWCRGVAPLSDTDVLVSFSKLRETKIRENLKWIGNKLLGQNFVLSLPTRIARYDLARGLETWRMDLDAQGLDAVFSIHVL